MLVEVVKDGPVDVDLSEGDRLTLDVCLRLSVVHWCGVADGQFACAYGLIPPTLLSEQAYLWLLTTTLVDRHKFAFVRHSQRVIEKLLDLYPRIVGHCLINDKKAQRWLRWLGAEFDKPSSGAIPFVIEKHG